MRLLMIVQAAALAVALQPFAVEAERNGIDKAAARIAQELLQRCPAADPSSQAAFDACRSALYRDSALKQRLSENVLWGRQSDPSLSLKDSKLTQFAPDVLTGMYLPLFMFNGQYTVVHAEREGLYQIRLQTAFRNRMAPGQFPYPFWHEAEKWAMYQSANELILWWDAKTDRVKVAQFTMFGAGAPVQKNDPVTPPAFDGQWRWTDAHGKTQPAVTVFDGLLRPDNPYAVKLDAAYKDLALRLRQGQCFECHVPSNPDKMKRLVLLQTPVHAAGEIKRVMKTVREDTMPRDEHGMEAPLDAQTKAALLDEGAKFERLLDMAKQWEQDRSPKSLASQGPATP